ncbi:MAG: hypothetical protein QOF91_3779 [Alphaproteobacteria bacterium]|jgi:hypothetical protein|nr:hypothetical protein [Alphaproteobacteria bacterium]MEA3028494.1 hypothetical protein [Alphaproteobacteria bacterium]
MPSFSAEFRVVLQGVTGFFSGSIEPFSRFPRLIRQEGYQGVMADRAGLGFVGFILGGVTAAVMLVALTIVIGHVDGRLVLEASPAQIAANQ